MHKLFLDANIFFAATYSETGASRALFKLAEKGKIKLVSSTYAIQEAKRNINFKIGEDQLPKFYALISLLSSLEKRTPSINLKTKYQPLITKKDLPILLGAIQQKSNYLITLDRKHFKTQELAKSNLPLKIMLPGEYLQSL